MVAARRSFTDDEKAAFVDAANPHQWLLVAGNLHLQAQALWRGRGLGRTRLTRVGQPPVVWDDANRATFLVASFAMENMLKAFLVYEHPRYVADGRLSGMLTHDLGRLADASSLLPHKARDRWVCEALAEGNESWARYPCGRDAGDVRPEGQFTDRLWARYCGMMQAYERKMRRLLTRGWQGPDGFYGTWTFSG